MKRLLLTLIILILTRSNVYAWSCYATIEENTIVPGTLYCDGIELDTFFETYLCVPASYWVNDPYCTGYQAKPACSNTVEYQTTACTEPNTIGVVNQSRDYYCEADTYGPWITTSENCSPAPATCIETSETEQRACGVNEVGYTTYTKFESCPDPYGSPVSSGWIETENTCQLGPSTCIETTESRGIACDSGYEGIITQIRTYQCSDPYGQGQWTDWVDSSNSCVQTLTNPMNITSPVSPISPIGITPSTDPSTEVSQSMSAITTPTDNVTAPESVQILTTTMPELMPLPKEESGEAQQNTTKKEEKKEATTNSSEGTESQQGSKPKEEQKEEKKTESKQEVKVPAGKELVPGFGITMSLDILNNGIQLQEIQLNDVLTMLQEQEYGQQQNILLDFIFPDDVNAGLSGIADYRWRSLFYDNPLQSDAFGD